MSILILILNDLLPRGQNHMKLRASLVRWLISTILVKRKKVDIGVKIITIRTVITFDSVPQWIQSS